MFIRFLSPPDQLWERLYLFLMDEDQGMQFTYAADGRQTTIGNFVRDLLAEKQHLNTVLPRIPVLINRDILAKLHSVDSKRRLKIQNEM